MSNFKHIYLERIVNILFHLQRCHQTASLSIYGVHFLFSFVFIFLIWFAHVERDWIWLMIIFFWYFDKIIGTCTINYILPKRNHNFYLLILLQYHGQALVLQNFSLHIQLMHLHHLYIWVLMLFYNWLISVQDKKEGSNVATLLWDSLKK